MPRTALTPRTPNPAGVASSMVAADQANGMYAPYSRDLMFHVKCTGATCTVTIGQGAVFSDGILPQARTVSVPGTTGDMFIGPFPQVLYMQADGNVYIDFSISAGVTVEAINPVDPAG